MYIKELFSRILFLNFHNNILKKFSRKNEPKMFIACGTVKFYVLLC
jgi:hypothetical protein